MKFTFSDRLWTAMRIRGLTGAALADLAGVNGGVITSALRGQPVQLKSATRISQALAAVPVIDLMDDLAAPDTNGAIEEGTATGDNRPGSGQEADRAGDHAPAPA